MRHLEGKPETSARCAPHLQRLRNALLFVFTLFVAAHSQAGVYYEFDVIVGTGDFDSSGNMITSLLGEVATINDLGNVGFIATNNLGQSLYIGDGAVAPTIISFGNPSTRTYHNGVQINNNNQVIARDRSGSTNLIRVWEGDAPGTFTTVVRGSLTGGTPLFPAAFDAVFSHPALSNNNTNAALPSSVNTVFSALDSTLDTVLSTPNTFGDSSRFAFSKLPLDIPLRPMVADDGTVVARAGNSSQPITAYANNLTAPQVVSSGAFTVLGRSPGISSDGDVIAFAGDRGNGPGVFVSLRTAGSYGAPILVAGENGAGACLRGEIGLDATGAPLCLNAFELDARVGIVRNSLGDAGFRDDALVVSFIATPSAASQDNPAIAGVQPLTFSANAGLWTIRVDLERPTTGVAGFQTHLNSPLPVVQVGDRINHAGSDEIVSSITVYDPIALASHDLGAGVRTQRRGDHRLAFRVGTASGGGLIVRAAQLDSDQDGLFDHWERVGGGIDIDQDGVVDLDLSSFGATVGNRDLFLEIDWGSSRITGVPTRYSNQPGPGVTSAVAAQFAGAPALSGARYGVRSDGAAPADIPAGVLAHIDAGTGNDLAGAPFSQNIPPAVAALRQGGDVVRQVGGAHLDVVYFGLPGSLVVPGLQARSMGNIKDGFFGTTDKRARELAFHYTIFADYYQLFGDRDGDGDIDGGETNNAAPFVGTVASATANTIQDAGASPFDTVSTVRGHAVITTQGTGAGQLRRITGVAFDTLTVFPNWATTPDATTRYVVLSGSSGLGEVEFRTDLSSRPGNDHLVTLGGTWGVTVTPNGNYVGQPFWHSQTLAHELGHTLGLRHGGTNHVTSNNGASANFKGNYRSLMNYAYQLANPQPANGVTVTDYSQPGDAVFVDWDSIRFDFPSSNHKVGNTFGLNAAGDAIDEEPQRELTVVDVEDVLGPSDLEVPLVTILTPLADAGVAIGSNVDVVASVTDNVGVESVTIAFDVDGDGDTADAGETVVATPAAGNNYEATFVGVAGSSGDREIQVFARDRAMHVGIGEVSVAVSDVVATVSVPAVVGLSEAAAGTALTGAGLMVGIVSTANSDTVPVGIVISQDPIAGTDVAENSAVDLVVSVGPPLVTVPVAVGLVQADAEAAIIAAGLSVGTVTTANSDTVAAGSVISQNPPAGSEAAENSGVDLVVSLGPVTVAVPDVVGLPQVDAEAAIVAEGLVVGVVTSAASDTVPAGSIISQDPVSGSNVATGSAVNLEVSTGAALISVPDVVGATQAAAEATINGAGLTVGAITTAASDTVPAGNVISQDPVAGSNVATGSAVNLEVSTGAALISVPDVVGATQAAAEATINGAGLTVGAITTAASDTVPAGNVISQDPASGSNVATGTAVNLEVSTGVILIGVPDVVGATQAAAEATINGAGLTVGAVTTAASDTVPAGNVISQNPAAGSPVVAGIAIDLVVSSGPANREPTIISTPDTGATVGTLYTYDADATDLDGDPLVFSLVVAPAGMTIDAVSGLVQWIPSIAQVGVNDVSVLVSDGRGGEATQSYGVTVEQGGIRGDVDGNGEVNILDIRLIASARNTPANDADDPRDIDGDGVITVNDGRQAALLCTKPRCAQ